MKITRRTFMQAAGGGAAASMAGCKALERGYPEEYWIEQKPPPGHEKVPPGEDRLLRSVCLQCEGGCGIEVRVVEGRAVRIAGNRDYPTNQGGLCPKGVNGLQTLYDPDRIRGPLRREGERGAGSWKPISWDEALAEVAARLSALRQRGQPQALAVMGGRYRGHMRELVRRFLTAYGSPNGSTTTRCVRTATSPRTASPRVYATGSPMTGSGPATCWSSAPASRNRSAPRP
jgi:anaerobic selenocysteine-containing dehydrogenase